MMDDRKNDVVKRYKIVNYYTVFNIKKITINKRRKKEEKNTTESSVHCTVRYGTYRYKRLKWKENH